MPLWCLKTIVHGGKSSRAIVGGDVRYCPLDPRLKTRVCARTMYHLSDLAWAAETITKHHLDTRTQMLSAPSLSRKTRTEDLSEDTIYEALSNRRRRYAIHAIKREECPLDAAELSTYVTAWEQRIEPDEVEYADRKSVYGALTRTHLPKLDDAGIIEYDSETKHIEPTDAFNDVEIHMEVLKGREIPWHQYYLGLSGLAVVLLLAVQVGVPGFAVIDPLTVGVFVVTAFAVSALTHHHYDKRGRLGADMKPPEARMKE